MSLKIGPNAIEQDDGRFEFPQTHLVSGTYVTQGAEPEAESGLGAYYASADGKPHFKADDGTDFDLSAGGADIPDWLSRLAVRPDTAHADDDEFNDGAISGDWTEVVPSGNSVWVEDADLLSAIVTNQTSADIVAQLRSMSETTAPITIETVLRLLGRDTSNQMAGLVFSDGVTTGANAIAMIFYNSSGGRFIRIFSGTLTNMGTLEGTMINIDSPAWFSAPAIYGQMIYSASNTFKFRSSPDGVGWSDFGLGSISFTLTPTHYGLFASTWGDAGDMVAAFEYFRVYETDESA